MSALYSDTINITNIVDALRAGNTVTGGVFWNGTILVIFVMFFSLFKTR
jgi:hypothetical protein